VTLANRITIGRLVLIPIFIVLVVIYVPERPWIRHLALGVFVVATISDALDGFVARAYNQKTRLGAVLDPLADKLLVNLAFVFLAVNQNLETPVPYWLPVVILSRDVIIVIGAYLINEYFGPFRARPRISGKLNTAVQMACIITVLLEVGFLRYVFIATLVMAVVSFFDYLYAGIKQAATEDAV
jgi:CDP-diacylglycerol--glycerol-3-phosphate 3-phosphatidyltransferase/cardiolipin synthase